MIVSFDLYLYYLLHYYTAYSIDSADERTNKRTNEQPSIMVRKLQVGVSGLGRMGARHALHFLDRTPRAELVAAFDPDEKALAWARQRLEPYGTKLYSDYEAFLQHPGLEAVVVAGITTQHAAQTIRAIEADKHVLCEKPLSTSVKICEDVERIARAKPHLKVLCGFSRRFDGSYRDAAHRIQRGDIGRPAILRSQTCDKHRDDDYFVQVCIPYTTTTTTTRNLCIPKEYMLLSHNSH